MSPSWNCELHRIYGSHGADRSSRGQTQTFKPGHTPTLYTGYMATLEVSEANIPIYTILRRKRRRRQWHPTPVLLPGKSHGRRSLVGCSPWGHEESDTTERIHSHFSLSCIGEGNGNPLQCSCLENPRDGGAWWAAVYGVAQSWTRLSEFTFIFHFHALEKEMATHSSVLA